jgi:hypothetical protein
VSEVSVSVNVRDVEDWTEVWTGAWPVLLPVGATFEIRPDPGGGPARNLRVLGHHLVMFAAERFAMSCVVWAEDVSPEATEPLN